MTKRYYFVKSIKKINLIINRLIKNNLNKLNTKYLYTISKSNKFILSFTVSIVLFLSYLSIPNIYDHTEVSNKLNNQLQKRFDLNFNLSKDFHYNFFPRPHFVYKNSSILKNQTEISKIGELKVYIALKNLFSYKNFQVKNLILEKSNFNLNNQNYDFFIKLLDSEFKDNKIIIKDSNIFYRNKTDEVLFINKILKIKYFYYNKNLQNKLVSKNELFNLPYSIELNKDNIKKKIFSSINFYSLKLKINNELDFNNEEKKGLINFSSNKSKYRSTYSINKNNLFFNLVDSLENSNFSYNGEINFSPFYSKLEGSSSEFNILNLLDSNSIVLQMIKTQILNNKNLDINLNIFANKSKNFFNFNKIYLNSKILEGLIDIDNTKFSWKNSVDFLLEDSLIYVKEGELILDGRLSLIIKNSNEIYKFLQTPKNYRTELKNIEVNFVYNFDKKTANLNNIIIDKNNNRKVNEVLKNFIFKKNNLQNRVYLKTLLNRAAKGYAG